MSALTLYLFGPPCIEKDNRPLKVGRRKAVALLAYLAVDAQPQSRDSLATLFWPEYNQRDARTDLSRTLSYLNRIVGQGWLMADRQHIRVNRDADLFVDVTNFQQLVSHSQIGENGSTEQQLALLTATVDSYHGDFMAGFALPDSPAFDDWHAFQTHSLQQQFGQALARLSQLHALQRDYELAITTAQRWLRLDTLHEPAHRQLMQLYAWSNQHAAALRQYRECEHILQDDLGVTPDHETVELFEVIKSRQLPDDYSDDEQAMEAASVQHDLLPVASPPLPLPLPEEPSFFVGRIRALEQLEEYLERALTGHGQIAFVTGEAGAGKSALVSEFAHRARTVAQDLLVLYGNCNAQTGISDPYLPFRELLQGLLAHPVAILHLAQTVTEQGRDLLGTLIAADVLLAGVQKQPHSTNVSNTDWFNQLEGLATSQGQGGAGADSSRIFEQFTVVLQTVAAQQPLLLILDDLHWVDVSSASLLFHICRRFGESPILIVGTYRPEDAAIGRAEEQHPLEAATSELKRMFGDIWIYLNRLPRVERRQFVDALLDSTPNHLSESFRQALFRHTEGHALFTVELLHDMQTRGDLTQEQDGFWIEHPDLDWTILPAKVEGAIEKRMDRLNEDLREVLLVASVAGEEFYAEVVAEVLTLDFRELVGRLSSILGKQHRLVQEQGIQRVNGQRLTQYRFRHSLFQNYLYNCLGEGERDYLHEEVGEILERFYMGQVEKIAATLAHHFQRANLPDRSSDYLFHAGKQAIGLGAYDEAMAHLHNGLRVLRGVADSSERARLEIPLRQQLANAFIHTQGYASQDAEQMLDRARALCQQINERAQLCRVLPTLVSIYNKRGNYTKSRTVARELLDIAANVEEPDAILNGYAAMSSVCMQIGDFEEARYYQEKAIEGTTSYETGSISFAGRAFRVGTLANLSLVLMTMGYPDTAVERYQKALDFAQVSPNPFITIIPLIRGASIYLYRREIAKAEELIEQALPLAREKGFSYFVVEASAVLGHLRMEQGRFEESIALLRQAIEDYRTLGVGAELPYCLRHIAEAQGRMGEVESGLSTVDEAFAIMHETGELSWEAVLYLTKGRLLASSEAPYEEVETCFRQALAVAQGQHARWYELNATMHLTQLWKSQGKCADARHRLTEIYNWFTEGFGIVDLQEAKAMLRELKQCK